MSAPARRHLLLIGLPGAGKTAAGQAIAGVLGCRFTDVDRSIELREGSTVAMLFASIGEAGFRAIERQLVRDALDAEPQVIAPGGGWAAQPGNLEDARGRALIVYLRVSPAAAAARLPAPSDRPLLAGDPESRLRALLAEREPAYRQADATVDTEEGGLEAVADRVAALARREAGW